MLQEVGASYELVKVDLLTGAHKTADHVARHAHGLVPALEDGDVRIIESVAACLYLADKYPGSGLAPAPSSPDRARYYQFACYAVSTLDESVVPLFFQKVVYPPERRKQEVVDAKMPVWETAADFLTRELGDNPYLLGKTFSAQT
jgi:glutathione S-transferase